MNDSRPSINTRLAQVGRSHLDPAGAVSVPIYQTAMFRHPGLGQSTGYDYSRSANPTRTALEQAIASLEGGARGLAFASGMAAITTIALLFRSGDHLVLSDDLYGGTYRLFQQVLAPFGLETSYLDTGNLSGVAEAIRPNTKALFIETPTNPTMKVSDLAALAGLGRERGLLTIVDNTFMTPYLQRPLELGCDLVVHSATKYLGGHNDLVAGLAVARDRQLGDRLATLQNATGGVLGPQDCWLLMRGMKTLGVRLDRQQESATAIARWLLEHPRVEQLHYPGLPSHPGAAIHSRQASGAGGMVSFAVREPGLVERVLSRVRLISFAESLGGVESLITFPAVQTHADVPAEVRERLGITDRLLRLSVGIEAAEDLIADLEQALA
ncbi:MAG TPA: PLP-dependent aspartate aminotransferase family protein [Chloroflexota bacterium]|nr:PLP-dependent aspartate aminotransferase family protein [Chloroflexota bacterium]